MRPLDSNTKTGVTPPKHTAKQRILREYAIKYNLRIFVETGTYRGDMVEAMRGCCDHIYSIELSETLYQDCLSRFRGIPGIELIHGDSGVELGTLIKQIRRPALFWLDGHYSGGITARGTKDTPIMQELAHILSAPDMGHVIIIDDARCFGTYEGYPAISELCQYIQSKRPNTQIDIQDDMIRILPAMNQSKAAKSSDKVQNSALETIDRPLNARTGSGDRIIQFTQLGQFGRFGNQIFQYVFARLYAEKTNSVLEIPEWIGTKIFKNIDHPKPSRKLPRLSTDEPPNGRVNVDLCGYFQKQHFVDQFDKEKILSWLQFKDGFIDRYRHLAYDVVAHLRRGDYASKYAHRFCIVSEKSYVDACRKFNLDTENLHWVSQETQTIDPELPEELRFLPDFFTLINAKHLLRANSSFSFWAGFFNKNKVYSPVVAEKVGLQDVQFSEGNAEPTASRTGIFHFSNTFGGNKETVSSAVKNYCIHPDYVSQQHPEFQNMADCSRKVVYQRFVYEIARKIAVNKQFKSIVDMGCGGARKLLELLPEFHTIGVDLEPTVNKLRTQFPNHQWLTPDEASAIKRVDMVISADVIEHVPDPDAFLESIINMNPKVILISTPDRDYLVDVLKQNSKLGPPQNKTHLREWTIPEFNAYISKFLFIHRHMKFHNVDQISQLVICSPKNLATHRCTFGLKSDFSDEKVEQIVPAKTTAPVAAPRVSVLMAVHNGRDFVRQAVKSIYRQTFQDFEFVIVDDASTDGTSEILEQLKNPHTTIIRNETKQGLPRSLNIGLRHCKGELVARMDADDISLPERFAKQVMFLDSHPDITMVGTWYYFTDAAGKILKIVKMPTRDSEIRQQLLHKNAFGHGTIMIRRKALVSCGGYDERFKCCQDLELWLRLVQKHRMANLDEPLYCWRSTPTNITSTHMDQKHIYHEIAFREARQRAAGRAPKTGTGCCSEVGVLDSPVHDKEMPEKTIALIVSIPERAVALRHVLACISPQVDEIRLMLNGYQQAPEDLRTYANISKICTSAEGEPGACGAWTLLGPDDMGYVFLLDDDIVYPSDYVETLIGRIERYRRKAAVAVHGMDYQRPYTDCIKNRVVYHFMESHSVDSIVHCGGTGTLAFHTQTIRPKVDDFPMPNIRDLWFAILAMRKNVPIVCVARRQYWLQQIKVSGNTIWHMSHNPQWHQQKNEVLARHLAPLIEARLRQAIIRGQTARESSMPPVNGVSCTDNLQEPAAAKVSVILACRNEERYLAECLDSVLAQTLSDWELLVVDDGSTDRTREILKAYAARDSRIRMWFFDDCKGPYVRRNFAIGQSRAPYISIQDADDLIVPEKLATLYRQIAGDERLGVVGSANRKFLDIIPGIEYGDYVIRRLSHEEIMADFLGTLHLCWQGAALIRRRLFETVGLYDENPWGSDAFWLAKAGMYGYLTGTVRYLNLPECLTLKRERDDSQTGQLTPLDPRSRRHRVEAHYRKLLFQIGNAYRQNPGIDIAAGLRACSVQDYIDSNAALFERCESAPVTEAIVQQMTARIRSAIECGWFVTALMNLNVLERMAPQICRRWPEFDWLAALSLYAAGHDDQAADRIARLDRAGQSRNVLDCSIPGAAERKRRAMTFYRNLNKYPQPLDTGQIGQPVAAGR